MNDFWNERYGSTEYAYGEQVNELVKNELGKLEPGKILFPAEGEGRNAVYAAIHNWEVTAFDPSIEGQKKAFLLADKHEVHINYLIDGYETVEFPEGSFDCLVLVFAHMPPQKRRSYHQKLVKFLKPGGTLILEGFSKDQLGKRSGGPPDIDMLFSKEELEGDFSGLRDLQISETDTVLNEGPFHQGIASVIRILGKK